jgi:hypothetical protein
MVVLAVNNGPQKKSNASPWDLDLPLAVDTGLIRA